MKAKNMQPESAIILREATIADLAIVELWDEQPHVLESDPDDDWEWEVELQHFPDWRSQWIAEHHGRPIGFIQIIDPQREETHYWGEIGAGYRAIDIWIGDKKDLGKGYGTKMMELAINHCFSEEEVHTILIDPLACNTKAHRFYERLGFVFVKEQRFDLDDCFVYQLSRNNWEIRNVI